MKKIGNVYTIFKRFLFREEFPQQNAETVDVIFDCARRVNISEHLRCHVRDGSTSSASGRLCSSLLLPLRQTKVTYL